MRSRGLGLWGCRILLAGLASLSGAPGRASESADLAEWASGPIRYIARKTEIQTFKDLKTDEDRALFVEKFWGRRDPTPETLGNEYRQLFWERVRETNDRFLDSHKPGWKTDRGKIHILHGPPTDIQEELDLATDTRPGGARGVIRWIYEGRPDERLDMDAIVVVPFVRDAAGAEWRISHDPELASVFWDPTSIRDRQYHEVDRLLHSLATPRRSELTVMLDLGRMQEIPTQAQVLLERVETFETYRTRPIVVQLALYRYPDSHSPIVVVTTDLSGFSPDLKPSIVARFVSHDATQAPRILGEDSFRLEQRLDHRVAQGRLVLSPQSYDVTVMVLDQTTAVTGLYRATLHVPPESGQLRFSDVVFVDDLKPLEYAGLASYDEPYHVGGFFVVPRLARFHPGDTVRVFFELYGGTPPYRTAYQLQGREDDGSWVDLGEPSRGEPVPVSEGWELPTSGRWPPGAYRIRIDVQDAAEGSISIDVPFELEKSESPEPE